MNYLFLIVALVLISKYAKGKDQTEDLTLNEIDLTKYSVKSGLNISDKEKKEFIFIRSFIYGLLLKNDAGLTPIPLNVISAIVYQESSKQILKGMKNNEIEGYDGLSIGYFQVTRWAVAEYNQRENKDLSYSDCYNEETNVLIGLYYLYLCWVNNKDNIFLTAKKYNGGIGQTINSNNSMATVHATKVQKWFNIFESIIEK